MNSLKELFIGDTVAHTVLVLSLIAALGLALGSIRIYRINLGIAGVLFAGLIFGHFQITFNEQVADFIREFGLVLFVYTIGVQVGPGFTASLKRQGLPLNIMAAGIIILGVAVTLAVSHIGGIDTLTAVGLYSGGVTNTPSLGAAQQAIKDMPGLLPSSSLLPGLGYAIAYPFGIIGTILSMLMVRLVFRVDQKKETEALTRLQRKAAGSLTTINLKVTNPNITGMRIRDIPGIAESGVVVSRILQNQEVQVADPESILSKGDVLLAVGPEKGLRDLRIIIGEESDVNLGEMPSEIITRRIIITKKDAIGKSIQELDLPGRFNVTVTRVSRADIEFAATWELRLQFADTLLLVGDEESINRVSVELGNSPKRLDHPQLIPVFVGIAVGVILGSWPIHLPGIPAPVKLGLAGGPLVAAIVLSRVGRIGPMVWYMPISANFMMREVGIVLFLSCVGLRAGEEFVATLTHGNGLEWMAWAMLITLVPLLTVAFIARAFYRLNFVSLCGLLAGSMTDPPALAFAISLNNSDAPSISYATVYPMVMLARVVTAQAIVMLLVH